MVDKYVMVFHDWPEATRALSYQEKGRLIEAIVKYARGDDDWEELLKGNERFLFPMFQAQIDRSAAQREQAAQAHRASGKLGGRPKNQNGFEETKQNQNGFAETKKTYNKDNNNNKDKDNNKDNNNHHHDDGAGTVEAYASLNLQHMSPGNIQDMIGYMQDLPDDVIRFAIDEACSNGAPRWAYVSSILAGYIREGIRTVGDARAAKAKRQAERQGGKTQLDRNPQDNPALNYAQRGQKHEIKVLDLNNWE